MLKYGLLSSVSIFKYEKGRYFTIPIFSIRSILVIPNIITVEVANIVPITIVITELGIIKDIKIIKKVTKIEGRLVDKILLNIFRKSKSKKFDFSFIERISAKIKNITIFEMTIYIIAVINLDSNILYLFIP